MANRKRSTVIRFCVTEEEKDLIKIKMNQYKTNNMGAYLRKIAIDGYVIVPDHKDIQEQTAEIQKIGVNINQIAKRINSTDNIYKEDIYEIKECLNQIWQLQRQSLLKQP